jgi:hypothetical protein
MAKIEKIVMEVMAGANRFEACKDALMLSLQHGVLVEFFHNGERYYAQPQQHIELIYSQRTQPT